MRWILLRKCFRDVRQWQQKECIACQTLVSLHDFGFRNPQANGCQRNFFIFLEISNVTNIGYFIELHLKKIKYCNWTKRKIENIFSRYLKCSALSFSCWIIFTWSRYDCDFADYNKLTMVNLSQKWCGPNDFAWKLQISNRWWGIFRRKFFPQRKSTFWSFWVKGSKWNWKLPTMWGLRMKKFCQTEYSTHFCPKPVFCVSQLLSW